MKNKNYAVPAPISTFIFDLYSKSVGHPNLLPHVNHIAELYKQVPPDDLSEAVGFVKNVVQYNCVQHLGHKSGIVVGATGFGKSRIALILIDRLLQDLPNLRVLIVVPTEKLRDENWKEEFDKWEMTNVYQSNIKRTCYASLHKIENEVFDLVVLDEVHNITPRHLDFFASNYISYTIGLTATYPKEPEKLKVLSELKFNKLYEITVDQCVKLQLVSPYQLTIVNMWLDDKDKYVKSGTKEKPILNTEKKEYDYISNQISNLQNKDDKSELDVKRIGFLVRKRMRFLYEVKSKYLIAESIITSLPESERTLIFCGSIKQANQICKYSYHSKSTDESLNKFISKEVSQLSCVDALNEGMNIPDIDNIVIIQLNQNERDLIQRIGRGIRYRPNHICKIWIIAANGTKDKKWITNAIQSLTTESIKHTHIYNEP